MKTIISLLCFTVFSLFGSAHADMLGDEQGHIANVSPDGHLDVHVGDQTSPVFIAPFHHVHSESLLTVDQNVGDRTITVADTTDFIDGAFLVLTDPANRRYSFYRQVGAPTGNVITLDGPLDFAYGIGDHAHASDLEMAVDGSVTPIVYGLRQAEPSEPHDFPVEIDITRIIISCTATNAVDLAKFCDLPKLTNGLLLRHRDGQIMNIFNVKQNLAFATIAYDFTIHEATNPAQGQNGFVTRLTFGGSEKMGVVIRIGPGEDLELMVQDNLSTLITLNAIAEGHVVTEE